MKHRYRHLSFPFCHLLILWFEPRNRGQNWPTPHQSNVISCCVVPLQCHLHWRKTRKFVSRSPVVALSLVSKLNICRAPSTVVHSKKGGGHTICKVFVFFECVRRHLLYGSIVYMCANSRYQLSRVQSVASRKWTRNPKYHLFMLTLVGV